MWLKHLFFWMVADFVVFLVVPFFSSPPAMWGNAKQELQLVASAFGLDDARTIARKASSSHAAIFQDTGLLKMTRGAYVHDRDRNATPITAGAVGKTADITNQYLDTFAALTYIILLRLYILFSWGPFIFPFFIGLVGEGYARRKIKFAEFGEAGAAIFSGAIHLFVLLLALPLFYLMAPFAITPLFVPGWILIAALPIVIAIANANQLLPR